MDRKTAQEQADYLQSACAGKPELRRRVEELLRAHEEASSFLAEPSVPMDTVAAGLIREGPGTLIGPYKLLEQIGEGGFGLVFMAEQQKPVRRKVAVKVLKPGMDTRHIIARFEAERQALALMDHAHIARVLDAGETATGRPYFTMELVRGIPITDYCDKNGLTPRQRLELFLTVCHAVQHAHQKGIIHRDIKPSNVLITLHDGTPVAKVIDFGIAKALGQQLTDKTLYTGFAQLIGTPLYMSPEQAEMSGLDVDTRSDIYSLGVLLYELLTGTTPFDKERLGKAAYDEILRIIREEEPATPSTRLSTMGEAATAVSERRQSDPKRLSQLLSGELDWIVMKALEKDRNRRYETASAFAADVQRYLQDEPVAAGPPSMWYRYRKFARRNRVPLTMAAVVTAAVLLVAGTIGWVVRDRGARQAALEDVFGRASDEAGALIRSGNWPEALAVIERSENLLIASGRQRQGLPSGLQELARDLGMARRLEEIHSQPGRVPEMSGAPSAEREGPQLGASRSAFRAPPLKEDYFTGRDVDAAYVRTFQDYGIDVATLPPAESAERIRRRSIRLELSRALDFWSSMRRRIGHEAAKECDWQRLLEIAKAADPDPWRNPLRDALLLGDLQALKALAASADICKRPPETLHLLGWALKELGAAEHAVALLRQAQRQYPDDLWLNDALGWFCFSALRPRQYDDSVRFYTAALALRPHNPYITYAIGRTLLWKGSLPEAIAHFTTTLQLKEDLLECWWGRGEAYAKLGQGDRSLADFSRAIELDPKNFFNWYNRGWACVNLKKWQQAVADSSKAIELDAAYADAWFNRGWAHGNLGRWDNALADFSKVIDLAPNYVDAWSNRGWVYGNLNQWDKAVANYSQAIKLDRNKASAWSARGFAQGRLGKLHEAVPDFSRAIELDSKDAELWRNRGVVYVKLAQWEKAIGDFSQALKLDAKWAPAWNSRGMCYSNLGQADKALADFSQAIKIDASRAAAWTNRGIIYSNLKQWDKALADFSKAIERDSQYADAWLHRAGAFGKQGQWDKAVADYFKLIELKPKNAAQHNMLAWLLATHADAKVRDARRAVELAQNAVKLAPKEGDFWNTLGVALYRADDWRGALEALGKSTQLQGENVIDSFFQAMAHWQIGDKERARTCYDRAARLMHKKQANHEELRRFRAEAARVLGLEKKEKDR